MTVPKILDKSIKAIIDIFIEDTAAMLFHDYDIDVLIVKAFSLMNIYNDDLFENRMPTAWDHERAYRSGADGEIIARAYERFMMLLFLQLQDWSAWGEFNVDQPLDASLYKNDNSEWVVCIHNPIRQQTGWGRNDFKSQAELDESFRNGMNVAANNFGRRDVVRIVRTKLRPVTPVINASNPGKLKTSRRPRYTQWETAMHALRTGCPLE